MPIETDGELWKSTITIWSAFDPRNVELSHLAREAESGVAICSDYKFQRIETKDLTNDPDYDEGTSEFFFGDE